MACFPSNPRIVGGQNGPFLSTLWNASGGVFLLRSRQAVGASLHGKKQRRKKETDARTSFWFSQGCDTSPNYFTSRLRSQSGSSRVCFSYNWFNYTVCSARCVCRVFSGFRRRLNANGTNRGWVLCRCSAPDLHNGLLRLILQLFGGALGVAAATFCCIVVGYERRCWFACRWVFAWRIHLLINQRRWVLSY